MVKGTLLFCFLILFPIVSESFALSFDEASKCIKSSDGQLDNTRKSFSETIKQEFRILLNEQNKDRATRDISVKICWNGALKNELAVYKYYQSEKVANKHDLPTGHYIFVNPLELEKIAGGDDSKYKIRLILAHELGHNINQDGGHDRLAIALQGNSRGWEEIEKRADLYAACMLARTGVNDFGIVRDVYSRARTRFYTIPYPNNDIIIPAMSEKFIECGGKIREKISPYQQRQRLKELSKSFTPNGLRTTSEQEQETMRNEFETYCVQGTWEACSFASSFMVKGIGGERQVNLANDLLRKGCNEGNDFRSCILLAEEISIRFKDDLKNLNVAKRYYRKGYTHFKESQTHGYWVTSESVRRYKNIIKLHVEVINLYKKNKGIISRVCDRYEKGCRKLESLEDSYDDAIKEITGYYGNVGDPTEEFVEPKALSKREETRIINSVSIETIKTTPDNNNRNEVPELGNFCLQYHGPFRPYLYCPLFQPGSIGMVCRCNVIDRNTGLPVIFDGNIVSELPDQ